MNRRRLACCLLLAVAVAPPKAATSQTLDSAAILARARPDIDEANQAWVTGFRQRNAGMAAAAYADSGLFIGPDGQVVRGRAAITRMYADRLLHLGAVRDGAVIRDGYAAVAADRVYEWGHAWLEVAAPAGGPATRSGGGYLTVWQLQADGHWRIVRNLAL
jgi:uncharacterized protein (TIGR02246 family)